MSSAHSFWPRWESKSFNKIRHNALRRTLAAFGVLAIALLGACVDVPVQPSPTDPPPASVAVVQVLVPQTSMHIGQSVQMTAILKDSVGTPLVRPVVWESALANMATVSATGLVTAVDVGTVRITARSEGKSGFADLTVTPIPPAPVHSVVIQPSIVLLNKNEEQPLTIEAKDQLGNVLEGRTALWTSSAPSVVTVNSLGRVTAIREGQSTITVAVEGVTANAIVQVRPPVVARVVLEVETQTLEVGDDLSTSTRAEALDGEVLHGRVITLTTSNDQVAILAANGKIRALRAGTTWIRAYSEGQYSEVLISVTEPPAFALLFDRISTAGIEIFLHAVNGTVTRLNAGNVSRHPSPSPDGQRFVFGVVQNDLLTGAPMYDLFAVDRNGLNMRHLTQMPGVESEPVWSPDGTKIAFAGAGSLSGMHDIYVMNADGTGVVNLTANMPWSHETSPSWSPDSKTLAFGSMEVVGGGHIYTIDIDGTNKRTVASGNGGQLRHPTWSPNGTQIAFSRAFPGVGMDIVILPRNGGAETRIERPGDQVDVVWSPDGKHFAFAEAQLSTWFVMTMRTDGTAARIRSPGGSPAWIRP